MVEKVADVQERVAETRQALVHQEFEQENEKRATSVNESEGSEGTQADSKKERERRRQERKKRERQKEIARRIKRDTGHIVDLEA